MIADIFLRRFNMYKETTLLKSVVLFVDTRRDFLEGAERKFKDRPKLAAAVGYIAEYVQLPSAGIFGMPQYTCAFFAEGESLPYDPTFPALYLQDGRTRVANELPHGSVSVMYDGMVN